MHGIYGASDIGLYLYTQLNIFICWLLEDKYSFVPHFSLVVRQHLHPIVQYYLAVGVVAKPF
jgi:hypothetical protein